MSIEFQKYLHEEDKVALDTLRSIPVFSSVLKAFMKILPEQFLYGINMAQKIRLGPNQLPEIYKHLPPICDKLGIEEPELYLEMNPVPNAYTYGDTRVFMTVTSGLIESMEEDEIKTVFAHECGHIACHHVLYKTMAYILADFGLKILGPLAAVATPVYLALLRWERKSELSADRAAALVMGSSISVIDTLIRLAGGPKSITGNVDIEVYIEQAKAYSKLKEESFLDMMLQGMATVKSTHPFLAVRTKEIFEWGSTDEFAALIEEVSLSEESRFCSHCGRKIESEWSFCNGCGKGI